MTLLTTPQTAPPATGRPPWLDLAETAWAVLGTAGLLAEYAFNEPPVSLHVCRLAQTVAVLVFLSGWMVGLCQAVDKAAFLRRRWLDLAVVPAAAIAAVARGSVGGLAALQAGAIYVAIRQAGLIVQEAARRAADCVAGPLSRRRPVRLILTWYLSLTVLGGLLLALPKATTADHRNSPYTHLLNSTFTAASATCDVGLNVYELPGDYTLFGQTVILALVQAGGLGMLVAGTLFGMLLVRRLSGEPSGPAASDPQRIRRIIGMIAGTALGLEAVGAVLLYPIWSDEPTVFSRTFHAVFHAVGAFCNAGFSLQKDSLVTGSGLWQVYGVILPLSVLGGLGFPVLYEAAKRLLGAGGRAYPCCRCPRTAGHCTRGWP